jgi:hypothetical protein
MRAARNASRASALAMNPNNVNDSVARRIRLLDAFRQLDEDDQADLLEAAEAAYWDVSSTRAKRHTTYIDINRVMTMVYVIAGWGEFK